MRARSIGALLVVLITALVLALSQLSAAGGSTYHLTLPVGSFVGHTITDRNSVGSPACSAVVTQQEGDVFRGRLNNAQGGFVESVNVPTGATITGLSLFVRDADADPGIDAHAFLLRKRIADGLSPDTRGFGVMAHAVSSGGAAEMRKFSDTTVANGLVDNAKYMYYVELDVCFATVEPYAVQVTYTV
jgi:hypothetical protein